MLVPAGSPARTSFCGNGGSAYSCWEQGKLLVAPERPGGGPLDGTKDLGVTSKGFSLWLLLALRLLSLLCL